MFRVKKWRDDVNPIGTSPVPTFLLMNIVPLHEKGRHSEAFPWFESQIPNVPPSIFSLSNSFSMRLLTLISNLFRLSPLPDPRFQECTLTHFSLILSRSFLFLSYFSFIYIGGYKWISATITKKDFPRKKDRFIGNKNVVNGMVGQAIARLSIRHQLV